MMFVVVVQYFLVTNSFNLHPVTFASDHDRSLQVAVCNGKPTIIDFYADWCASCKEMAPSMRSVETQYKDRINFISVDGSNSKNGMF